MLFQAYTGGRPAEFVHASKGKASQDPLSEAEEANKHERLRGGDDEESLRYNDDSDAGDGPSDDKDINYAGGNEEDEGFAYGELADRDLAQSADHDSGYNSDEADGQR